LKRCMCKLCASYLYKVVKLNTALAERIVNLTMWGLNP